MFLIRSFADESIAFEYTLCYSSTQPQFFEEGHITADRQCSFILNLIIP